MADYTPVSWTTGNTATATQFTALSAALDEEETINTIQDTQVVDYLNSGIVSVPRIACPSSGIGVTSQSLYWVFFTADRDMTVSTITFRSGGTAAAATPSLIRWGLYSESIVGDLSLIASTPNDTTLLAAANTTYSKAFSASADVTMGSRYGAGLLVVSATTTPTMVGTGGGLGSGELSAPLKLNGILTSQTDLPSSVVASSVGLQANGLLYARLS